MIYPVGNLIGLAGSYLSATGGPTHNRLPVTPATLRASLVEYTALLSRSVSANLSAWFLEQQAALMASARPDASAHRQALRQASVLDGATWLFFDRDTGQDTLWQRRQVTTGDSAVSGMAHSGAARRAFGLTVNQLAQAQQVRSDNLAADDLAGAGSGTQQFQLTREAQTFDLSLELTGAETGQQLLQAVAGAVNNSAGIGVRASVTVTDGTAALNLTAISTGAAAAFTLTDVSGTLLVDIGLRTDRTATGEAGGITAQAQDASYTIDSGPAQTSSDNTLDLFDGSVVLWLGGVTDGPVTVTVESATPPIQGGIDGFVAAYNDELSFLQDNPSEITDQAAERMSRAVDTLASALEQIGIRRNDAGPLTIDDDELLQAVTSRPDRVQSIIAGAAGLATEARQVNRLFLRELAGASGVDRNALSHYSTLQDAVLLGMLFDLQL